MKRKKNNKIIWIIVGLLMACFIGIGLLPDTQPNNKTASRSGQTLTTPTTGSVAQAFTPTEIIPTSTPAATPTKALVFPYTCIPVNNGFQTGLVTRIVDGDTIHVNIDGQDFVVRYIGVDAPEVDSDDPLGEQAKLINAKLVEGKTVTLVRDVSETDSFHRLLRYVLIGTTFVNHELIRAGVGVPKQYPPDTICQETLENALVVARTNQLNINSSPPFPTVDLDPTPEIQPTQAIVSACPNGCTTEQAGCSIKGNISSSGEKIYHVVGMRDYTKTVISPEKGERWFCTENDAVANGWRRALR
ncbi:MAG: hypothetical protein D9V45_11360 [Chloroflexi bacterium]|nr:MAG: hypothetical protein D9V45_11360 [Chloroflexota bacterium]